MRQPALVAGRLAGQAADDDDHQRRQQHEGQEPLAARLAPGDQRGQEDAGGQVGGGHEEEGQLQVPGAGQVVGQQLRQVDAEEAAGLRVVVRRGPAEQRLHQEQGGDDEEVPGGDRWAGVSGTSAGGRNRSRRSSFACQPSRSE